MGYAYIVLLELVVYCVIIMYYGSLIGGWNELNRCCIE